MDNRAPETGAHVFRFEQPQTNKLDWADALRSSEMRKQRRAKNACKPHWAVTSLWIQITERLKRIRIWAIVLNVVVKIILAAPHTRAGRRNIAKIIGLSHHYGYKSMNDWRRIRIIAIVLYVVVASRWDNPSN